MRIRYQDQRGVVSVRDISPHTLRATDRQSGEMRTWRLDRIESYTTHPPAAPRAPTHGEPAMTTTTVTLRCTATSGNEIATLTLNPGASQFARTALTAILGNHETGALDAELFARIAFTAAADYDGQSDLQARVILKHLRALDRLALAAVSRGIPATITWS